MNKYEVGEQVEIANITNPPYPEMVGKVGLVVGYEVGDQPFDTVRLYTVLIEDLEFKCYGEELSPHNP